MSERSDNARYQCRYQTNKKMSDNDLGTKKTLIVLVIVVGCFAVLWPKVLYPMLLGSTNQRIKPNNLDKGCCDVISDIDINTIKIMNELCNTIVQDSKEKGPSVIEHCRKEVFNKCGIDISAILQEHIRLGRTFKQIIDEVRSHNGSLCLKYQFGISPWRLGAPHRVTINLSPIYVRQERPSHLRPEMLHPALRERGSAIVQPYQQPAKPGVPRYVEGRPGPVPGVRPPLGGAGHMVHAPKSSNSMGVIMPIYTVGIVIFFSYTLMKLLFKKKPEGPGAPLYPTVEPSATFRKEVFESQKRKSTQGGPLIVNAMTALLDEVDQELEARRKAREVTSQKDVSADDQILVNGSAKHDQPSVKVLGMEMTASCEGGKKWDRCESPVIPKAIPVAEETIPAQEIFLEGTLPAQSQLLVADSTIEEEANSVSSSTDPPVILASKMTLSVISLEGKENDKMQALEEDSKYTTASDATVADCEVSDEEENDIEDDLAKVSNCQEEDADLPGQTAECDVETNEEVGNEADDLDKSDNDDVESIERSEDNSLEDIEIEEIIIFEDMEDEGDHVVDNRISPNTVENIGNIIDEIITDGALRLENEIASNLENFQHSTEDCDMTEDEKYNNNEPSLDQNENAFEHQLNDSELVESTDLPSRANTKDGITVSSDVQN